jgi:Mannosyl-glycoprotein endo-beta-N-acetylglucosaminidase
MKKYVGLSIIVLLWKATLLSGQGKETIQQYIDQYRSLAIAEMQRTGVPASIKLAQGIHETQAGTSVLVQRSNNHFGIKCKTGWSGPSVRHDDDERSECFRKYETAEASFVDHSNFLKNSPRYFPLFDLSPTDYVGWAQGLKKAGYATNPQYAQTLVRIIEEYDLNRYTLSALGQPLASSGSSFEPAADAVSPVAASEPEQKKSVPSGTDPAPRPAEKFVSDNSTKTNYTTVTPAYSRTQPTAEKEVIYPSGVFEKEGCRAVWVKAGTPFLAVADQYRIALTKLFEYNNMEPILEADRDQVLFLERRAPTGIRLPFRNKKSR